MLETAKKYILDFILENEEVKKFPRDFISTSMKWIRSWFLIDDDPVTKVVLDSSGNEALKIAIVEQKLPKLLENEEFKQQLELRISEFAVGKSNIKNVVSNTQMDVHGNVHIGDTGQTIEGSYEQKNVVHGSVIKAGGDFRLGDDIIQASGNVHIGDINHHVMNSGGKTNNISTSAGIAKTFRSLVTSGRSDEAIAKMLDYAESAAPNFLDDVSQLSARWETLKRKERAGILSVTDTKIEQNQVSIALLELIGKLPM